MAQAKKTLIRGVLTGALGRGVQGWFGPWLRDPHLGILLLKTFVWGALGFTGPRSEGLGSRGLKP